VGRIFERVALSQSAKVKATCACQWNGLPPQFVAAAQFLWTIKLKPGISFVAGGTKACATFPSSN